MESAKKSSRGRTALLVVVYLALIGLTIWAEIESFLTPMMADGTINGPVIFRFFTNDSNILMALSCLACLPGALRRLFTGEGRMGRGLILLRFVGTVAVSLTFWTVMLYLGPVFGYRYMFYGVDIYLHIYDPVLCILTFIFLEREEQISPGIATLGMLPMLGYGAWYYYEVGVARNWNDFYGFLGAGPWWMIYLGMALATYVISFLLSQAHNQALGKNRKGR